MLWNWVFYFVKIWGANFLLPFSINTMIGEGVITLWPLRGKMGKKPKFKRNRMCVTILFTSVNIGPNQSNFAEIHSNFNMICVRKITTRHLRASMIYLLLPLLIIPATYVSYHSMREFIHSHSVVGKIDFRVNNFLGRAAPQRELQSAAQEQTLFHEMEALKKTIPDIILMSVSSNDSNKIVMFCNLSIKFVKERMNRMLQTNLKFVDVNNKLGEIESMLDSMNASLRNSVDSVDQKKFDSLMAAFLTKFGLWYKDLKVVYDRETRLAQKECAVRMRNLEFKISHQIHQTQRGHLCEKSTRILHFREPTIVI